MKDLLEAYFGKHYGSTKLVSAVSWMMKGQFSFSDSKACADCHRISPEMEGDCDKVVLRCDSYDKEVEAIELEAFIDNYANLKAIRSGKKCDLLLVDDNKVVFCDMTCSLAKYIAPFKMADGTEKIGKRNTVRRQIGNSITLLVNVPEIASVINTKSSRVALFAYREKPEKKKDAFDTSVTARMKSLDIMSSTISKTPMYSEMDNGFTFTEVRNPIIYSW